MNKKIEFENYIESIYFFKRDYNRIKRIGKNYLNYLINNCPAKHEQEFNQWCYTSKNEGKRECEDRNQSTIVECLYIAFLNNRYKRGLNVG